MSTHENGWIAVDLDGTLAHYDGWKGATHIGEPIGPMVERVKEWLAEGRDVRIFTARLGALREGTLVREEATQAIAEWCQKNIGRALPMTCIKDMSMCELWDDRCVCVERNTGRILGRNP